ncbi:MAG: sodium:solute symporter family protein, partial [Planctomycetota bacterium]
MTPLDWIIVGVYMAGMIVMSVWVGRKQANQRDYYITGNRVRALPLAMSTMATQCSTNSLLGAPAFVIATGGLLWLQYELAVPLAMIGVMVFLLPLFRKLNLVSIYEYLERRFGVGTRTLLSVTFQCLRAFSTGVTVYGISLVVQKILGVPFWSAALILGIVTIVYDFFGGMRAVIYSDVIQMLVLVAGVVVCFFFAMDMVGGWQAMWQAFPAERGRTLDFTSHGFGDGKTFAFWPMLIGGLFLYVSYYGCDQTQIQREISSRNVDDGNRSLFINGLFRFPLVVAYCFLGVAIGAYLIKNPGFIAHLYDEDVGGTNYNLAVPVFCLQNLPMGVKGVIIAALFAAAMSSLDSTINSLSALTVRDVIERFLAKGPLPDRTQLLWSRLTTVFWGGVCVLFSLFVGGVSKSIIESINKITSLATGPILATFLLGVLTRTANGVGVVIGVLFGFACNLVIWKFFPDVSWLWWNVIGFVATFATGYVVSSVIGRPKSPEELGDLMVTRDARKQFGYRVNWPIRYAILG